MKNKYSYQGSTEKIGKAQIKRANISFKHSNETCAAIKGKKVDTALKFLERVINQEEAIPYKRYTTGVGHRKNGIIGRYPKKAAKIIKKVLENAKANAEFNGLDTDKLVIKHASAYRTHRIQRRRPKGGGASPALHHIDWTAIEIVVG